MVLDHLKESHKEVQKLTWAWRLQLHHAGQIVRYRTVQLSLVITSLVPWVIPHRRACVPHCKRKGVITSKR